MAGFRKAVKHEAKLRLALAGPAGSGKTYTALAVATALANGRPVAVIDTERGSASKYADLFEFDVLELEPPYHPDRYIAAMREAQAAGYAVLVIDSLSHAWTGPGGLLEVHEQVVQRQTTKNTYTAWAQVTPIQTRFIDAITGSGMHIIATMRAKTEYVQGEGKGGRTEIRKVGTAPIQRDGMEFEFDIMGEMNQDNTMVVGKTRCPALAGAVLSKPGRDLADTLRAWLSGSPAPEPAPAPAPAPAVPAPQADGNGKAPTTPAAQAAPKPKPTWAALQARAHKIGLYTNIEDWQAIVIRESGGDANNLDYSRVAAYVAQREAEAAAGYFPEEAVQGPAPDLRALAGAHRGQVA